MVPQEKKNSPHVSFANRSQLEFAFDYRAAGATRCCLLLKGTTVFMRHGTLIENTSKLKIKFKSL